MWYFWGEFISYPNKDYFTIHLCLKPPQIYCFYNQRKSMKKVTNNIVIIEEGKQYKELMRTSYWHTFFKTLVFFSKQSTFQSIIPAFVLVVNFKGISTKVACVFQTSKWSICSQDIQGFANELDYNLFKWNS